jgi:hypothetical protein
VPKQELFEPLAKGLWQENFHNSKRHFHIVTENGYIMAHYIGADTPEAAIEFARKHLEHVARYKGELQALER